MKPWAVFGGTFDPVHLGHLGMAWEASELLAAEVRLVPARVPPHRPVPQASAEHRAAMLRLALRGQERLQLDTRELEREGPSYTVDTLAELRAAAPQRPLILLVGTDAFAGLPHWYRWRDLFRLAHIAIVRRAGASREWPVVLAEELAGRCTDQVGDLHAAPAGCVTELAVTPMEVSASRVRELLAAGREPRYLVPAALFDQARWLAPYRPG